MNGIARCTWRSTIVIVFVALLGLSSSAVADVIEPGSNLIPQSHRRGDAKVLGELVLDGGFEAGTPNPYWSEYSTYYGSPVYFGNPYSGLWSCYFRTHDYDTESASVQQTLFLPVAAIRLTFYVHIRSRSWNQQDYLRVLVDQTTVFEVREYNQPDYPEYTRVILDLSGFGDGSSHTLRFESTIYGAYENETEFFVDDVSVAADDGCALDPPLNLRVEDAASTQQCLGTPLLVEGDVFTLWWDGVDGADGYGLELYVDAQCTGTPYFQGEWPISAFTEPYSVTQTNPLYDRYCWRVRGFADPQKQLPLVYGCWSDCCCYEIVECSELPPPTVTSVGGVGCGGTTLEGSPTVVWSAVNNALGYDWELREESCDGPLYLSGDVGSAVTTVQLPALAAGTYAFMVRARGDESVSCTSQWTCCVFTVGCDSVDVPSVQSVGGAPCGGSTEDTTPTAIWSDVEDETGYSWELRAGSCEGRFMTSGLTGIGVTQVTLPALDLGPYGFRLRALGDGVHLCDSEWTCCTFHVGQTTAECGNGECEEGETAWGCEADCGLEHGETGRAGGAWRRMAVQAAVGGVPGVGGTFWLTEGMVFNPGNVPATVTLSYTPDGAPGEVLSGEALSLAPETARYFANVVVELFGVDGNGSLWIDGDQPVMFDTRVYNLSDEGTYGQALGGVRRSLALGEGDGRVYLVGLSENAAFRTNVILQEVSGHPTTAVVSVFDGSGEPVGEATIGVGRHSKVQKRLSQLGFTSLDRGYATVAALGQGQILALCSVVDAVTGDATTIDAVHPNQVLGIGKVAAEAHFLIAAVARKNGINDTVWRSDLVVMNPSAASQQVELEYHPTGASAMSVATTLLPGQQLVAEDLIEEIFGLSEETGGSLHVYASSGVIVNSRAYNIRPGDGATLGQQIPGLSAGEMAQPGETWVLNKLKNNQDFRCNIGFSEYSGVDAEVSVVLFDVSGASRRALGSASYSVSALSNFQVNEVFKKLGIAGEYREALAYVTVHTGQVYIYGSVVDNRQGDGTTVLAKRK